MNLASQIEAARPEIRALVLCARAAMMPEMRRELESLLAGSIDWDFLREAALQHGMLPLTSRHLKDISVPASSVEGIPREFQALAARSLLFSATLKQLVALLSGVGIQAIPYKGPVLAARLYGNFAMRQFGDLDFLIRREDAVKARFALVNAGFRFESRIPPAWESFFLETRCEYAFCRPSDALHVELHWALASKYYALEVDISSFWDRLEKVQIMGVPLPSLGMDDLLLTLCLHGTRHLWERLAWLADIAEVIRQTPSLDWSRLLAVGTEAGAARFLLVGLALVRDLLGVALPFEVEQRIRADPASDSLVRDCARRLLSGVFEEGDLCRRVFFTLRARERLRDKFLHAWRLATVSHEDDWNFVSLPPSLALLYPLIKPLRLLLRKSRKH